MAFCKNCGKEFPDVIKFCPYCGCMLTETLPPQQAKPSKKNVSAATAVVVILLVLAIVGLFIYLGTTGAFPSFSNKNTPNIEILSEKLYVDPFSGGVTYYISAEVKNTSSNSVKVSYYAKIYRNGTVVQEGYSNMIYLNPGETGKIKGISFSPALILVDDNYSYSIEKWNIYST